MKRVIYKSLLGALAIAAAQIQPAQAAPIVIETEAGLFSTDIKADQSMAGIALKPGRLPLPPRRAPRNIVLEVCCTFNNCAVDYDPSLGSSCSTSSQNPKCDFSEYLACLKYLAE